MTVPITCLSVIVIAQVASHRVTITKSIAMPGCSYMTTLRTLWIMSLVKRLDVVLSLQDQVLSHLSDVHGACSLSADTTRAKDGIVHPILVKQGLVGRLMHEQIVFELSLLLLVLKALDCHTEVIVLLLKLFTNFIEILALVLPEVVLNILAFKRLHLDSHGLKFGESFNFSLLFFLILLSDGVKLLGSFPLDGIDSLVELNIDFLEMVDLPVPPVHLSEHFLKVYVLKDLTVLHLAL